MDRDSRLEKILEELRERRAEQKRELGGPRSKLVDAIMVLLLTRPMRSSEIAGILGYETRYISSYLSYWKTRGYVEYSGGFWMLTPKGEEYAEKVAERERDEKFDRLALLAQRILSEQNVKQTTNGKRRGRARSEHGPSLRFIAPKKGSLHSKLQERALAAACFLETLKPELSDEEVEVLSAILSNYTKWGSTYMYIDQLARLMEADYRWILEVARLLQTKNIVYLYTDPKLGIRIGLTRPAKELLEECAQAPR
ncbi:MAG: replication initiator protein WhiP [Desulfurococcales archaeon]|nr:replication initiator protein WhiP [Desulfurococcales archaeon]